MSLNSLYLFRQQNLKAVNGLTVGTGVTVLTVCGFGIVLIGVESFLQRRYQILRFVITVSVHNIRGSGVIHLHGIDCFSVAGIAVAVFRRVVARHPREPRAAFDMNAVFDRTL